MLTGRLDLWLINHSPLTPDELRRGEQRAKELQKEIEANIAAKKAGK